MAWRPSSNLQVDRNSEPRFWIGGIGRCGGESHGLRDLLCRRSVCSFLEGNEVFVTTPRSVTEMSSGPRGSGVESLPLPQNGANDLTQHSPYRWFCEAGCRSKGDYGERGRTEQTLGTDRSVKAVGQSRELALWTIDCF